MKIKDVYLRKGIPVVSLTLGGLCVAVTALSVLTSQSETFALTYPVKYPWQLVTYVFQHHTPQEQIPPELSYSARDLTIGHLGYNLLLLLPYGILVEKVIGSKRLLLVSATAWLVDTITMFGFALALSKKGTPFICKGGSGVAFSFVPLAAYILFVLGKKYGLGKLLKQLTFYLLMPLILSSFVIAFNPTIAGTFSMVIHLIGILCGALFAFLFRKKINL